MTKVLIVGAGPCGLVALKEMLAAGLDATVIEKATSFGGVFRKPNVSTYDDLYLTTSNFFMAFSDFPPVESEMRYSSKEEYQAYLSAYVEHFDLLRHVQFGTEVGHATFDPKTGWSVDVVTADGTRTLGADYLIVATGSHHVRYQPEFDGYAGRVLHSSDYRGPAEFDKKRVLVVGTGESASDIAAEVCEVAKETVVWSRRPFLVAPRYPLAVIEVRDYDEHEILTTRPESQPDVNNFLEFFTISRLSNSLSVLTYSLIRIVVFSVFRWAPFVSGTARRVESWTALATADNFWMQDQSMVVTKNSRLSCRAAAGDLAVVIAKEMDCAGLGVEFSNVVLDETDGAREFDVIIACTGYQTQLPWLDVDVSLNPRDWYKHAFAPVCDGKLVFLGWARPQQGGIPACAEMQARYAAQLATGQAHLPDDMEEQIANESEAERRYFCGTPHVRSLVDYLGLMDAMAELVGCRPRIPNPFRSPRLFAKYWLYPQWPCWYRKDGVGSNREAFESFLEPVQFKLGPVLPLLFVHAILLTVSAPAYIINWLLKLVTKSKRPMRVGWMWRQPKSTLLHGRTSRTSPS